MRVISALPFICSLIALLLSFFCIFAGNHATFMESTAIITLNTSRIGANWLYSDGKLINPKNHPLHDVADYLDSHMDPSLKKNQTSLARPLGLQDFYTAHLLNFCEGQFSPFAVDNATFPKSAIQKIVSYCSPTAGFYAFDPATALRDTMWRTHSGVTLGDDLGWPIDVEKNFHTIGGCFQAAFFFYILAILFCTLNLCTTATWVSTRLASKFPLRRMEVAFSTLAWFWLALASIIITGAAVAGANVVSKYGAAIGVSASAGGNYIGLTWVATFMMVAAMLESLWEVRVLRKGGPIWPIPGPERPVSASRSGRDSRRSRVASTHTHRSSRYQTTDHRMTRVESDAFEKGLIKTRADHIEQMGSMTQGLDIEKRPRTPNSRPRTPNSRPGTPRSGRHGRHGRVSPMMYASGDL